MLENYVIPELQQQNVINNDVVWMQDGAPPHIATSVPQMLQQHFDDRIMVFMAYTTLQLRSYVAPIDF